MPNYAAAIIGLTGIAARRPTEPGDVPLAGAMPGSHAAAYHRHPRQPSSPSVMFARR